MESVPSGPGGPPEDPEDWTDEQWLEWLQSTDGPNGGGGSPPRPRRRGHRAAGAIGTAMVGLHDVMYGRVDDQVVAVADASGEPPDDDRPRVRLDPDHPERSEVVVRARPGNDARRASE
jgi:hypothetical protein